MANLENQQVLLQIYKVLNKRKDKQSIFNLAQCSRTMKNILEEPIGKDYVLTIYDHYAHYCANTYRAYKIVLPSYEIDKLYTIMNTMSRRIHLDTLEVLAVDNIFCYDTVTTDMKTIYFGPTVTEQFVIMILGILKCYNIIVENVIVNNVGLSSCDIQKNFTNLTKMVLYNDDSIDNPNDEPSDSLKGVNLTVGPLLPHVKELHISYKCNIHLKRLLWATLDLETIHIYREGDSNSTLDGIESLVSKHCNTYFVPLSVIAKSILEGKNKSTHGDSYSEFCLLLISKVMRVYISKFVRWHTKIINIFGYTDKTKGMFDNILKFERVCKKKLCQLKGDNLRDIIMYAYKIVSMNLAVMSKKYNNMPTIRYISKM